MRRCVFVAIFCLTVFLIESFSTGAHAGDYPRYLILQRDNKGQATLVPAQPYAYGWFGAMPSSASTGHRNYSGTIFTWTYTPGY
jgi:hypothetical protein